MQRQLDIVRGKTANLKKLFILDSAFNPPTIAHHRFITQQQGPQMLMLATQNVDKQVSGVQERLRMMSLVDPDCIIATTNCAKFIDKAIGLRSKFPETELYFLMGMDTVERFFDNSYTSDAQISEFFQMASIVYSPRSVKQELPPTSRRFLGKMIECSLPQECHDLSSSLVRARLKDHQDVGSLVPTRVLDLIRKEKWYQDGNLPTL